MALTLKDSSTITADEVTVVVSLAPAAAPTRRKFMIRRKGETNHFFLDYLSPLVEPLYYLMEEDVGPATSNSDTPRRAMTPSVIQINSNVED